MDAQELKLYLSISNLVIGGAMLSIGTAIKMSLSRRKVKSRWMGLLFCAFFFAAGIGRITKGLTETAIPGTIELYADLLAGLAALGCAFFIWPLAARTNSLPSYSELQAVVDRWQKAYNELQYTKQLFESFMSNIPVVSLIRDANGTLKYVNDAFAQIVGQPPGELIGQQSFDWVPQAQIDQAKELDRHTIETGEKSEHLITWPLPDGTNREWLTVRFPLTDHLGNKLVGIVAVDLSTQAEQQALKSELAAIVENSDDAIIGEDFNRRVRTWNKAAERLFGYTSEEARGKQMSMLVPPGNKDDMPELLERVRHGEYVEQHETQRVSKSGKLVDIGLTISPVKDDLGNITGASVIARDITNKKKIERRIQELNAELQQRVYELAEANGALEAARDQALEASDLKSAFVANISHELRTPLSGILGMTELLLAQEIHDAEKQSMLQTILDSGNALLAVVNDILDLAKIEAGRVTLEYDEFNPAATVQDCAKLLASAAARKQLTFEVSLDQHLPSYVYGDESRLRQVLLNLLGNAVKFTEQGKVTVRADLLRREDQKALIKFTVSDTGIGIGKEEKRFLFKPFAQVDSSSTRKFGGTGLGLAISKKFVEIMNGNIGFESEKGAGSTFWFTVEFDLEPLRSGPIAITPPGLARIKPLSAKLANDKKVLVVEDNDLLRDLALKQLGALGIEAVGVASGREAIQDGTSGQFDIILMDVNLPDLKGNDATKAIRQIEDISGRKHVPIIAMTAGAMKADRERVLDSGMDDFLSKPVALQDLKSTLERWLDPV